MYEIKIIKVKDSKIAEVISKEVILYTVEDILDLMGNLYSEYITNIMLYAHHFPEEFFDLKTKFAGEILQKFSTYHVRLTIIGDFEPFSSDNLQAFIRESNRGNQVFFVPDRSIAIYRLVNSL
jgi:hypothetical protein